MKLRGRTRCFEREPLAKESPLLQINDASKLLMTPHIAWATVEARNRLFDLVVDNIQGFLNGDLKNVWLMHSFFLHLK